MNTAAFAGVAAYLLSMAVITDEPVKLAVGVTTIANVQRDFTIIDRIGSSYTGGPVLNLSEWEVNLEGIIDLQLAFNADGILDVATVKADKVHLEEVLDALRNQLSMITDKFIHDLDSIIFLSGSTEVIVDSQPMDPHFTINYMSADFKHARNQAQKKYA